MQARPVVLWLKAGGTLTAHRQQYSIIVFLFREGKENKVVMSPFLLVSYQRHAARAC